MQLRFTRLPASQALLGAIAGAALALNVHAQLDQPGGALDVRADSYEFEPKTGRAVGDGNVSIVYGELTLRADHVELNNLTKEVSAAGNVVLERGVFVWRGSEVSGNFETREFSFPECTATTGVWYAKGLNGRHHSDRRITMGRSQLSTCEYYDHPHYSIQARRVVYYPDGKFRAYHTIYKIGRVPIFYWPIVFGDADARAGGVSIKPGYDSNWGAFLLLSKEWRITDQAKTEVMLHLREKNGIALGNRTTVHTQKSDSQLLVYGMKDHDPPETPDGYNRRFYVEEDRYRFKADHRQELADGLNLRLGADVLSDADMLEDWFSQDYQRYRQARSGADLTYETERYTLSLRARPRFNDFYTVVERLPEMRFDMPRQPLGNTGVYYQGDSGIARLETKWRDYDVPRGPLAAPLVDPEDYEAWRIDSLHMLYRPVRLADGLQFVPRAGLRLTYYDQSSERALTRQGLVNLFEVDDIDNPYSQTVIGNYDNDNGDLLRIAGEVGLELKSKYYRVWPDATSEFFDVDGLRHVVEPYLNYTFAPTPSERRDHIFFFDDTDRLQQQHFVRLGATQRWQTRREAQIYTLASLDSYADFHFAKEDDYHHLGTIGNRFEFKPTEMLSFWGKLVGDMGTMELNRGEAGLAFGSPDLWRLTLSYIYRNDYLSRTAHAMGSTLADFTGENSLLARSFFQSEYATIGLRFPINDKTRGQVRFGYDLDRHSLAFQLYEVIRDLHCWEGALRLEQRNGETQLLLVLYLKAFPKMRITTSIDSDSGA